MEKIKLNLNPLQMNQVKLGIAAGIDASLYSSPEYTWEHMEAIRLLMQDEHNPTRLLNPTLTPEEYHLLAIQAELESGDLVLSDEELKELRAE